VAKEEEVEEEKVNNVIKGLCLAVYILAATGSFLMLPAGLVGGLRMAALVLLAAHALEMLVAFKSVKRYPGPLIDSIALTLLFGILHWKPLARGQ
jgi:hypothetical protein